MKFKFVLLLCLILAPLSFVSADTTPSTFNTRLQTELAKHVNYTEKEALVRKVSEKVNFLLQKKPSDGLMAIDHSIKTFSELFHAVSASEIVTLNTNILAKKITLSARAIGPTPMLYTGSFSQVFGRSSGTGLLLDEYSQIDPVEFVALSGTVFNIEWVISDNGNTIYQVTTKDYPYSTEKGYFIDARFVDTYWTPLSELSAREKKLPTKGEIISSFRGALGLPYIWWGDVLTGVPKLLEYYAPRGPVSDTLRAKWTLRWVDCSGLLYSATNGVTPRNTSSLVSHGTGLDITGKTASEIAAMLQPLDIIAWKGHTLIVLDNGEIIQSKADYGTLAGFPDGVWIRSVKEVLNELLEARLPVDDIDVPVPEGKKKFVIRRWYSENK